MYDADLKKNGEGYPDPTAYQAIKNVEGIGLGEVTPSEIERLRKCLHTIFHVCELSGFQLDGRVVLIDRENGRVWK